MVDSKINFLDTTVILNDRKISLEMYRKPTFTDKTVNFKTSISPKNYKWSTFIGEIFRCNNCTSDVITRDRAIEKTKQIFLKNNFPSHIMDQKIAEVKGRDFKPSENKLRREEDRKNPDLVFHTMSLPFTSFRCSAVASQIYRILKKATPNFRLSIVFSTIKLNSVILPRMKAKKAFYNNSNCVYEFECDCKSVYRRDQKVITFTNFTAPNN